jgi:hypothetical protein
MDMQANDIPNCDTNFIKSFQEIVKANLSEDEINILTKCNLEPVEKLMRLLVACSNDLRLALEDAEESMAELNQQREIFHKIFSMTGSILGYKVREFDEMVDRLANRINSAAP